MDKNVELVATKYAKAFSNVFMQHFSLDLYYELRSLATTLKTRKSFLTLLNTAALSIENKKKLMLTFIPLTTLTLIEPLIDTLVRAQRLTMLGLIAVKLVEVYAQKHKLVVFKVATTHELTLSQKNTLHSFLTAATHKNIIMEYTIEPALLAGIRITSSTYLWEHSIAQQLRTIEHLLAKQGI